MRLVCAITAFFIAFLMMRVGSLSGTSFSMPLGAALHATITFGLAITTMLLLADLATVSQVPHYRQLIAFTACFAGLLGVSLFIFVTLSGSPYRLPDSEMQHLFLYQYAFPTFSAWVAYGVTLWRHPSR